MGDHEGMKQGLSPFLRANTKRSLPVVLSIVGLAFVFVILILGIVDSTKHTAAHCNYYGNNETAEADFYFHIEGGMIFVLLVSTLIAFILAALSVLILLRDDIRLIASYVALAFVLVIILHLIQMALMEFNGVVEGFGNQGHYISYSSINLQMSCWRYKGSIYKVMTGLCGVCVLFMWSNIFWVLYLQSLREDSLLVVYLSFLNMLMGFVRSGKGSLPGVFYRNRILKVRLASQDLFSEIELSDRTFSGLQKSISEKFHIGVESIGRIIKDEDVLVDSDWSVYRLDSSSRLTVELDGTKFNDPDLVVDVSDLGL